MTLIEILCFPRMTKSKQPINVPENFKLVPVEEVLEEALKEMDKHGTEAQKKVVEPLKELVKEFIKKEVRELMFHTLVKLCNFPLRFKVKTPAF